MGWSCTSCGVAWSAGQFTPDCPECGGGAMDRACPICAGACGRRWDRAPLDSQDAHEAHWVGGCGLPLEEQLARLTASRGRP